MLKFTHAKKKEKHWNRHDNVVIGVSLHNPNLTGYRFEKIIEWVNAQPNFKRCYIDFADTLNRHNYMLIDGLEEDVAYKKAIDFGNKWLDVNTKIIEKLNMPHLIMRWDRWLKHPRFQYVFDSMEKAYFNHKPFKKAVDGSIKGFYERRGINSGHILPKEYRHSVNFILEEIAADTIIYESMKAAYVYPSKEMDAYKLVREKKVPGVPFDLDNSYYVRLIATQDDGDDRPEKKPSHDVQAQYLFTDKIAA